MTRSRQHIVALSLASSLLLAGCGAPSVATLAPVQKVQPAAASVSVAPAPSINVTRGADAGRQVHAPLKPIVSVEYAAMLEEEIAEDADALGFSLFANDKVKVGQKFSKTGIVRATETGFALETSKGLFKKKKDTVYTLTGSDTLLDAIEGRENKKALIKGVVDKDNNVTVESVKGLADLGFLMNWFSKARINGLVTDTAGHPLEGVKVSAKSADGFTFSGLSDADGEYNIKGVTPGSYKVSLSKDGFETAKDAAVTVEKRQAANMVIQLPAVPVETTP